MSDLTALQTVRLKGRVTIADLAAILDEDSAVVANTVKRLVDSGLLLEGPALRLSPDGRARLADLLATERARADAPALAAAYADFRPVNAEFKALVSDWQLGDGAPNTLIRLKGVHERVVPIIGAAVAQIPRLDAYARRLEAALRKVQAGDTEWLTRPLIDSYHSVWFELHEELILAVGLTRQGEAAAGHAD